MAASCNARASGDIPRESLLPSPSPGFGEGFVGEHHFVPSFHFIAPWLFHEATRGAGILYRLGAGRDKAGQRAPASPAGHLSPAGLCSGRSSLLAWHCGWPASILQLQPPAGCRRAGSLLQGRAERRAQPPAHGKVRIAAVPGLPSGFCLVPFVRSGRKDARDRDKAARSGLSRGLRGESSRVSWEH